MALSIYVHIPYCLQRCRYCDFTTFQWSEILPPEQYVAQVLRELRNRRSFWSQQQEIKTLYFGGGTPSLIAPELILNICDELAKQGFVNTPDCEKTIEINPATLDEHKLEVYLKAGINRFSVGAQSFNDQLLTMCGRKHSAQDTRQTLQLLAKHDLNYSFDLLFALPGQTLGDLQRDLEEVAQFNPPHLSAYCLTVPEGHSMSAGRPPEGEQVEMFARITEELAKVNLQKYEISNFTRPGFESRHNQSYWNNASYWGLGLSSHSYDPAFGPHGLRFWNPKSTKEYAQQVERMALSWTDLLPTDQYEQLAEHEALTDFCHMHLRTMAGLPINALSRQFAGPTVARVMGRLSALVRRELLQVHGGAYRLTERGQLISNKVFEELTFLASDGRSSGLTRAESNPYCAV